METMSIKTSTREELVNITSQVQKLVREKGWSDGALILWCPHTTGAVTINEAADPSVMRDIVVNMRKLIPFRGDYKHMEGNSDAHIKSSLFGPSLTVIVDQGRVALGTWQGIFFCEFDGPRSRKLWLRWISG
ncbi:MAG: secondary thiamine-phosphate synthase enzyme YjbQ [Thermodesulfobacteriota bacterium]|nr:secondary thiamine-phosphate synthase enzyme YjbQ [Thermodesulfobacteriota bacterium]